MSDSLLINKLILLLSLSSELQVTKFWCAFMGWY